MDNTKTFVQGLLLFFTKVQKKKTQENQAQKKKTQENQH